MNEKAKPWLVSSSVLKEEIDKFKGFSWVYGYVSKDIEACGYGNYSVDVLCRCDV